MKKEEVMSAISTILVEQQGIRGDIAEDQRICRDLGVCDGDFQEFMNAIWERFNLKADGSINITIPENEISVRDIVHIISEELAL